ncbi:MAG TPA: hypothetical protein VFW83_02585, partial [Bryobacteraceae bacterium]|nr:hypothetical protein [Bryobacteraceae bacterium]
MAIVVAAELVFAQPAPVLTGTHFPADGDFQTLKQLGYDFAVVSLDPSRPASWKSALDAAETAGIKLVPGGYPPPYTYANGSWTISSDGVEMLNYFQSRSNLIFALYVFNEPYSTNPYDDTNAPCGYFSAADLRSLRSLLQSVWPGVKIYQDLGSPSDWAPGGLVAASNPCVGTKYADQTGVADYVGIWYYPFTKLGYDRENSLNGLMRDANFVLNFMAPAQPISLNQGFACPNCSGPGLVFPSPAEMLDWNCATRSLPLAAVDWYPWRLASYSQSLSRNPAYWPLSTSGACGRGIGSGAVALSAASGRPFVSANSYGSIYGTGFASSALAAISQDFPVSLGGVTLQLTDSAGNTQTAPLLSVSPTQINFLVPGTIAAGQAAISL